MNDEERVVAGAVQELLRLREKLMGGDTGEPGKPKLDETVRLGGQ